MENKNLNEHICSDKVKWLFSVFAFILVAVFLAAACTQGFTNANPWGWFGEKEAEKSAQGGLFIEDADGSLEEVEDASDRHGVSLLSAVIPVASYDEYGISPMALSAVTVAVRNPSELYTYKWALAWKTSKSETVTNFVSLSGDTGTSVNVSALKAFDTQIILTCSAHAAGAQEASSSATCTVDYAQRFDGISLNGRKVTDGETIELTTLLDGSDTIVDALNDLVFSVGASLGQGSVVSGLSGTITVKSLMDMKTEDQAGILSSSPWEDDLAGFIQSQMYLSGEYYVEQMKQGDVSALEMLYEQVYSLDKDIEFDVSYRCGDDSGTVKFYINITNSLFASFAPSGVTLDHSGIVL